MGKYVNTRVLIKFLRSKPPYLAGETAAFPPHVAEKYIRMGVAEKTKTPKKKEAKEKVKKQLVTESEDSGYITK